MRKSIVVLALVLAACAGVRPINPDDSASDKLDFSISGAISRELAFRQLNDFPECVYPCLLIVR